MSGSLILDDSFVCEAEIEVHKLITRKQTLAIVGSGSVAVLGYFKKQSFDKAKLKSAIWPGQKSANDRGCVETHF